MKLIPKMRMLMRRLRYAPRTEEIYTSWVKEFLHFYGLKRHPDDMGEEEVAAFLGHLATERRVAPATQNQALNAIVFFYTSVLERPLGDFSGQGQGAAAGRADRGGGAAGVGRCA